jgi:hypothetical protein
MSPSVQLSLCTIAGKYCLTDISILFDHVVHIRAREESEKLVSKNMGAPSRNRAVEFFVIRDIEHDLVEPGSLVQHAFQLIVLSRNNKVLRGNYESALVVVFRNLLCGQARGKPGEHL